MTTDFVISRTTTSKGMLLTLKSGKLAMLSIDDIKLIKEAEGSIPKSGSEVSVQESKDVEGNVNPNWVRVTF